MKATILHNPNCGTSRKTQVRLRESGAELSIVEYLKHPPSSEELRRRYDRAGITPREGLRMKEAEARTLIDADAGDDAILAAMVANPVLIERPLVETDKGVRLCRPQEKVEEIL